MSAQYRGFTIPAYSDSPPSAEDAFRDYADRTGLPVFADAGTRDAAMPNPVEGEACFVQSVRAFQVFEGSDWIPRMPTYGYAKNLGNGSVVVGHFSNDSWELLGEDSMGSTWQLPYVPLALARETPVLVMVGCRAAYHTDAGLIRLGFGTYGSTSISPQNINAAAADAPASGAYPRSIGGAKVVTLNAGSTNVQMYVRVTPSGSDVGRVDTPKIAVMAMA